MNPRDFTQGSTAWTMARLGKCTGSRVADALSVLKDGKPSAARRKYIVELICERLLGYPAEHYVNDAMRWGQDTEKLAATAYEMQTDDAVSAVGICIHESIADFAASPDRLVGDVGLLEIKCPNTATHVGWILDGGMPKEYLPQCLAELSCALEREWLDFVSYDPRLPARYQMYKHRLWRANWQDEIAALERGVESFLAELHATLDGINAACPALPELAASQWYDSAMLTDEDIAAL